MSHVLLSQWNFLQYILQYRTHGRYLSVFSIGSGNLAAMGILEDRFKVNMDVSCSFVAGKCDNLCFVYQVLRSECAAGSLVF